MPDPSLPRFIETACYVLIFTAGWRLLSGHLVKSSNTTANDAGTAMAAVYS